ncbi:MAG: hypothetical protein JEZ09_06450 [Salinivirgaceae bacterium]|nr:hypothetical protein [Salinivirgaceae bacterium]
MHYLIITIIILFTFNSLIAQDFEVSPLKLFFSAEPGEAQTKFINVKNHNSKMETFILNVSDYSINNKGIGSYVEAGSMKNSVADWISIAPSFFELQPNEEKEIAVSLQQPTDEYGSKWGIIFVRTAEEQTAFSVDKGISAGVMVSGRIAINVYQTPGTNRGFKATIGNMSEISAETDSTRVFNALINNLGDIITDCKVFLIATNIETGEETNFEENNFTLYPKNSRKIELYMKNILPKGTYSLAAILDYGSKSNLEGTQIVINVK